MIFLEVLFFSNVKKLLNNLAIFRKEIIYMTKLSIWSLNYVFQLIVSDSQRN